MQIQFKNTDGIIEYHAHLYFDVHTRDVAKHVREKLELEGFNVKIGNWHEQPIGPHTKPMYQLVFQPSEFGKIVPWLMLNHDILSVLVHPITGDELMDHTIYPLWLGEKVPLNLNRL